MENVIVSDEERLEKLKQNILEAGAEKFHVLADFDRTLTKAFVDGEKIPSFISELRRGDYIGLEYAKKANALFDKYHPIEMDHSISDEEKSKAMHDWWSEHFELLMESGLNKKHLEAIVASGKIHFRDGALEFLDFLHNYKIPLVIMSSIGLGGDSIRMMLEREDRLYDNIHIISNEFEWDSSGRATGVKEPIIHIMNKKEVTLEKLDIYDELLKRKNVLLLGDGLGDIHMIEGFDYDNLIKIGFLSYNVENSLEEYKKAYDITILNDGSFNYVNGMLKEIVK